MRRFAVATARSRTTVAATGTDAASLVDFTIARNRDGETGLGAGPPTSGDGGAAGAGTFAVGAIRAAFALAPAPGRQAGRRRSPASAPRGRRCVGVAARPLTGSPSRQALSSTAGRAKPTAQVEEEDRCAF